MNKNLSPIQTLFIDSWRLFVKNLLNLFILNLLGVAGAIILGLVVLVVLIISGLGTGVITSGLQAKDPALLNTIASALPVIILGGVLLLVGLILLGLYVQIGSILILNSSSQKVSFGHIFKSSLKYMVPLILIGFLSSLMVVGGIFLFIIPGLVLAFMFSFYPFELIVGNKKGLDSLRSSIYMVKDNFWPLVLRFLLVWIIGLLINTVLNDYPIILFIVSTIFGWFTLCLTFILYKQVKSVSADKQSKLLIPIIISLAGLVVIFAFSPFIIKNLPNLPIRPANTEQIYESDTKLPKIQDI